MRLWIWRCLIHNTLINRSEYEFNKHHELHREVKWRRNLSEHVIIVTHTHQLDVDCEHIGIFISADGKGELIINNTLFNFTNVTVMNESNETTGGYLLINCTEPSALLSKRNFDTYTRNMTEEEKKLYWVNTVQTINGTVKDSISLWDYLYPNGAEVQAYIRQLKSSYGLVLIIVLSALAVALVVICCRKRRKNDKADALAKLVATLAASPGGRTEVIIHDRVLFPDLKELIQNFLEHFYRRIS